MTSTPYTSNDIADARMAAMRLLEARGWQRVEFCGLYQPTYKHPTAEKWARLTRILDTPRFEVAPIAEPTPMIPPRRLDYPVEACQACGAPIVVAVQTGRKQIALDAGWTGKGRIRLTHDAGPDDRPILVATYDRTNPFGHVEHSATCRNRKTAGRPAS